MTITDTTSVTQLAAYPLYYGAAQAFSSGPFWTRNVKASEITWWAAELTRPFNIQQVLVLVRNINIISFISCYVIF